MTARRMKGHWWTDFRFKLADGRRVRIRERSPVDTKRGAEEFERKRREELLNPVAAAKKDVPTLADFAKEFIENYARTNNKPSELRMKRSIFENHLGPALGAKHLDQIGPREIEAYKATKLDAGLSKKYVNNQLTVLRKTLSIARDWGLIERVPPFTWLRVPKPEFDFLDFDEAKRLVDAADGEWAAMIFTGLRTGLRQGELLALRWDDVDLVAGRLMVRRSDWRGHVDVPKNGRQREVPLSPEAVAVLKEHRHLRGELVFCVENGRALTENELRRPLYRACRRAGLRRIGWHVLRHTFASQLVMRGVPVKAVQELLGHTTIEMTMRYSHLSPSVPRDAVRTLDGHQLGTEKVAAK